jgi:hypothetical protein
MAAVTCNRARTCRDYQYEAKGVAKGGACPRTAHFNCRVSERLRNRSGSSDLVRSGLLVWPLILGIGQQIILFRPIDTFPIAWFARDSSIVVYVCRANSLHLEAGSQSVNVELSAY